MNHYVKCIFTLSIFFMLTIACKRSPKVIQATNEPAAKSQTGIFSEENHNGHNHAQPSSKSEIHRVIVKEVLPTERYVYLRVIENDEEFWIASLKQEVSVGDTYVYQGGLLKTNFESKEYNRLFDKVYLVSNLIKEKHNDDNTLAKKADIEMHGPGEKNTPSEKRNTAIEGSIKILDLINNISDYAGRIVQLSGECVKINPNILNRNWIHLKDGSMDDYDLVITSDMIIPEGTFVTLSGKVVLNQDFGSGYKYDVLIEEAIIK